MHAHTYTNSDHIYLVSVLGTGIYFRVSNSPVLQRGLMVNCSLIITLEYYNFRGAELISVLSKECNILASEVNLIPTKASRC